MFAICRIANPVLHPALAFPHGFALHLHARATIALMHLNSYALACMLHSVIPYPFATLDDHSCKSSFSIIIIGDDPASITLCLKA